MIRKTGVMKRKKRSNRRNKFRSKEREKKEQKKENKTSKHAKKRKHNEEEVGITVKESQSQTRGRATKSTTLQLIALFATSHRCNLADISSKSTVKGINISLYVRSPH